MLEIIYDYRLFRFLNFARVAILDFVTSYGCRYCQWAEVLLYETIDQPYYVMKSNMAEPEKFKSENER